MKYDTRNKRSILLRVGSLILAIIVTFFAFWLRNAMLGVTN